MREEGRKFWKLILLLISIIIPITVGLYIRFDDLNIWEKYKNQFYYQDRPLFTSYDAFFFARWGKDYLYGSYNAGERDPLRFVPDNSTYPSPIPMESWLGAELAKLKNTYIENISLWLTPFLAVLFIVPLVLYFFKIGLPVAGFSGAFLGVVSLMYLVRTSIARFDTDSLNLFFPFAIALFLLRSFHSKRKLKYLNLAIAGILSQAYCWWYAHPGLVVVILFVYAAVLFFFDKENSWKRKFSYFLTVLIFSNPIFVFNGVFNIIGLVKTYLVNYFKPAVSGGFPNVFMSISEAKHFDITKIAQLSTGNLVIFGIGFAGALLLFMRKFRETFLLLPIFLIGIMALKGGNRFAMYLSPFIGIGIGYLFDLLTSYLKTKKDITHYKIYAVRLLSIFLLTGIFAYINKPSFAFVAKPKITPELERDFIKLESLTPENSWIWTWWDYGTAIQYLAGRAVFHDGQSQASPKTYFVATSFSTSDPKIAHNVILGISNIGAKGINRLLKEGKKPEEIRNLIFSGAFSKPVNNPVYWAFTGDEIGKFAWINYFGTWNFNLKKGIKSPIYQLSGCRSLKPRVLVCRGLIIDLDKGEILQNRKAIPLKKLVIKDENRFVEKEYHSKGLYFEIVKKDKKNHPFLMAEQPYKSMFNQMYILRNFDKKYFELVYDDFPTMVLYRVRNE